MTDIFVPINPLSFECHNCKYITANKKDFNKHILTSKHLRLTKYLQEIPEIPTQEKIFICDCGKDYKHRQSLYTHKQKCNFKIKENMIEEKNEIVKNEIIDNVDLNDKNLILTLIQQNNELQKQMLEVIKNGTTNINNSMNNSHNKSFNLNVFLNETCKDAMNIMDFVDSIKIQLSDIESIGELGYVNGMSKLIIKHLNALDENMRPVHCSDPKRDSLYVKDANVWEKEDADNKKIKKAIKRISHKNICALPEWRAKYPDCIYSDSKKSDQYNRMVIEAMGGSGDNDAEKADKIVKKIAKEVTIVKNN
jgi:hypothetical protein